MGGSGTRHRAASAPRPCCWRCSRGGAWPRMPSRTGAVAPIMRPRNVWLQVSGPTLDTRSTSYGATGVGGDLGTAKWEPLHLLPPAVGEERGLRGFVDMVGTKRAGRTALIV